jgi:regulatory protein
MGKITALRISGGRRKRVDVFLDDRSALGLEIDVAVKNGLKVGQDLSADDIDMLIKDGQFQRCLDAALRFLDYRPRSEYELRKRLNQRRFDGVNVEAVINRLKEQNLLDDLAFARFWTENRESFRPRSRRLTRLELRQKGIADNIINQVVDTVDDEDSAYRAALAKARKMSGSDYQGFSRRLGDYLKRRGFNYAITKLIVERLWQELGNDTQLAE